jgi:hypothetical protein
MGEGSRSSSTQHVSREVTSLKAEVDSRQEHIKTPLP